MEESYIVDLVILTLSDGHHRNRLEAFPGRIWARIAGSHLVIDTPTFSGSSEHAGLIDRGAVSNSVGRANEENDRRKIKLRYVEPRFDASLELD